MIMDAQESPGVAHPNIIEMHMLDLYKFFPTMTCSSCAMRVIYYPFIKVTILQQQQRGTHFFLYCSLYMIFIYLYYRLSIIFL